MLVEEQDLGKKNKFFMYNLSDCTQNRNADELGSVVLQVLVCSLLG